MRIIRVVNGTCVPAHGTVEERRVDVEERIRRLEDLVEIARRKAEFCRHADAGDPDERRVAEHLRWARTS